MQGAAAFGKRRLVAAKTEVAIAPLPEIERASSEPVTLPSLALDTPRLSVHKGIPFLTLGLIALLALVFWLEVRFELDAAEGFDPSVRSLAALGGLNGMLVFSGFHWWRLFTSLLLHANLSHLFGNSVALLCAGWILERVVGPRWFAALFVVSALGGSIGSLTQNSARIVSVGASGAITGLLAAAFVCSFIFESAQFRARMQKVSLRLLVPALLPALLPLADAGGGTQVDYAGHFGGAIAGGLMGFLLRAMWPEDSLRPQGRKLALAITIAGVVFSAASFGVIALMYPLFAATPVKHTLIPDRELPPLTAKGFARSAELVEKYPEDPRAHLFRGTYFLQKRDMANAEREFRKALDQHRKMTDVMPRDFEPSVRIVLAAVLVIEGRTPEAKTMVNPACGKVRKKSVGELLDLLQRSGICV
jgi:rhomboid protease GluP